MHSPGDARVYKNRDMCIGTYSRARFQDKNVKVRSNEFTLARIVDRAIFIARKRKEEAEERGKKECSDGDSAARGQFCSFYRVTAITFPSFSSFGRSIDRSVGTTEAAGQAAS